MKNRSPKGAKTSWTLSTQHEGYTFYCCNCGGLTCLPDTTQFLWRLCEDEGFNFAYSLKNSQVCRGITPRPVPATSDWTENTTSTLDSHHGGTTCTAAIACTSPTTIPTSRSATSPSPARTLAASALSPSSFSKVSAFGVVTHRVSLPASRQSA